jgi:hypothetical protein
LASLSPISTALSAKAEPSVAIKMCVYMAALPVCFRWAPVHPVLGPLLARGRAEVLQSAGAKVMPVIALTLAEHPVIDMPAFAIRENPEADGRGSL